VLFGYCDTLYLAMVSELPKADIPSTTTLTRSLRLDVLRINMMLSSVEQYRIVYILHDIILRI